MFRFLERLQLCLPVTTLGDICTTVMYPAHSSHRAVPAEPEAGGPGLGGHKPRGQMESVEAELFELLGDGGDGAAAAPEGALSTMFLADFGADVVKVEQPGRGDEVRYWGRNKNGVGLYYKILGRGKRSVTLDLRTPFGVEAVKRLVKEADILVENYRVGTL